MFPQHFFAQRLGSGVTSPRPASCHRPVLLPGCAGCPCLCVGTVLDLAPSWPFCSVAFISLESELCEARVCSVYWFPQAESRTWNTKGSKQMFTG